MNKMQAQVTEFHKHFRILVSETPTICDVKIMELRFNLIQEEFIEFMRAVGKNDIIGAIDGLADLLYVVFGTCASMGIDIEPYFDEVHRSNMSKLGENGEPIYREDGKVLKPDTFSPPDLKSILEEHQ